MTAASAPAVPGPPRIGEAERLRATTVLSVLLHAMVVFGIAFTLEDAAPLAPTLDVIQTRTQTPLTPAQEVLIERADEDAPTAHLKAGEAVNA